MIQIRGKHFLVTGGAGFLGSHMCDALLRKGAIVCAVDNLSNGKRKNIAHLADHRAFTFIEADVNDSQRISRAFARAKPDYVMHYAAMVGVKRTGEDPMGVFRDVEGFKNIAKCLVDHRVKKLLFTSSSEAYGEPVRTPTREDHRLGSQWPYGTVKILGEQFFSAFGRGVGVPVTILRFFNVYGPRQDFGDSGFVVPIFLSRALQGKPLTLHGGGKQTRDFVYIDDNIRLSLAAFRNPRADFRPMNIGSGTSVTITQLAGAVARLGLKTDTVNKPLRAHGEILYRVPDISFMRRILRDRPRVGLDDGLRRTLAYMQSIARR